jgi:alpha-tubulin suppressor-like RCC1 family protein
MGQLGDGSFENHASPGLIAGDFSFSRIAAGFNHSCGLTSGGEVYCWGSNGSGQLGDGTTQARSAPVHINSSVTFREIRAGREHSCGVSTNRSVQCWGKNDDGQLGDGFRNRRSTPHAVTLSGPVQAIAVGWDHTCALTSDRRRLRYALGTHDNFQSRIVWYSLVLSDPSFPHAPTPRGHCRINLILPLSTFARLFSIIFRDRRFCPFRHGGSYAL